VRWNIREKLIAAFILVIVFLTLPVAFFFVAGYSTVQEYQKLHEAVFIEESIRQQCEDVSAIIPLVMTKDSQESIRQIKAKQQSIAALLEKLRASANQRTNQYSYQAFEVIVNSYLESCQRLVEARQANDLKEVTAQVEQALFKGGLINQQASKLIANEVALLSVNQDRLIIRCGQSLIGGILLLFLLILASATFVRSFSGKIRHDLAQILQAADKVASGSVREISLTPRSRDEIGDLALKFNWMAQRLCVVLQERDISDELLRQSYAEMENKVDMRTQELNALNQELIAMNEQLQSTVTILNLTQASLVQAEKMAALGNLVTGIAHELNTPVGNCITLSTHLEDSTLLLLQEYEKRSMSRRQLEDYLQDHQDLCRSLVLNLTTTAKLIQSFKKLSIDQMAEVRSSFSVGSYLSASFDAIMPQLRQAGISLLFKPDEDIIVDSYPEAFANVILSLIQNSLLHAFEPGQLGTIYVDVVVSNDTLYVHYRDDGRGVTALQLPHVFEPFFTTKRGRGCIGLGLHMVFNTVTRLLGGSIHCTSQAGQGIAFLLQIPLQVKSELKEEIGES